MNASKKSASAEVRHWEHGWDEHERMQLQRLARLSLAEKLSWLEEAHLMVMQLRAAHSPRNDDSVPSNKPD